MSFDCHRDFVYHTKKFWSCNYSVTWSSLHKFYALPHKLNYILLSAHKFKLPDIRTKICIRKVGSMRYTCTSLLFYLTQVESVHVLTKKHQRHSYLPRCEARCTQQMTAGLNTNVLVILCTDFTQLECGTHFTVQFILFLRHFDMVFWSWLHSPWEVRIYVAPIREQVTVDIINIKTKLKKKKNFLSKWSFVTFVIRTDGPQTHRRGFIYWSKCI